MHYLPMRIAQAGSEAQGVCRNRNALGPRDAGLGRMWHVNPGQQSSWVTGFPTHLDQPLSRYPCRRDRRSASNSQTWRTNCAPVLAICHRQLSYGNGRAKMHAAVAHASLPPTASAIASTEPYAIRHGAVTNLCHISHLGAMKSAGIRRIRSE